MKVDGGGRKRGERREEGRERVSKEREGDKECSEKIQNMHKQAKGHHFTLYIKEPVAMVTLEVIQLATTDLPSVRGCSCTTLGRAPPDGRKYEPMIRGPARQSQKRTYPSLVPANKSELWEE